MWRAPGARPAANSLSSRTSIRWKRSPRSRRAFTSADRALADAAAWPRSRAARNPGLCFMATPLSCRARPDPRRRSGGGGGGGVRPGRLGAVGGPSAGASGVGAAVSRRASVPPSGGETVWHMPAGTQACLVAVGPPDDRARAADVFQVGAALADLAGQPAQVDLGERRGGAAGLQDLLGVGVDADQVVRGRTLEERVIVFGAAAILPLVRPVDGLAASHSEHPADQGKCKPAHGDGSMKRVTLAPQGFRTEVPGRRTGPGSCDAASGSRGGPGGTTIDTNRCGFLR